MAATVTAKGSGFSVTGANRIVANFVISVGDQPGGVAGVPFVFAITFTRKAATPPLKMMVAQLNRESAPGGTSSVGVAATGSGTMTLGIFPQRDVAWDVSDDALTGKRTLQVTISSRDTLGTDELWHQELDITKPSTGTATFDIQVVSGVGVVSSVDVTP